MRDRNANPRAAVAIAAAAVAALVGFAIVAALPGVAVGPRVALSACGYASFVWIFRSALLRWRPDWDAAWNAARQVPGPVRASGASSHGIPAQPGRPSMAEAGGRSLGLGPESRFAPARPRAAVGPRSEAETE